MIKYNTSWPSCHEVFSFHLASFVSLFIALRHFCISIKKEANPAKHIKL